MQWAEQIRKGDKTAFSYLFDAYYVNLCEFSFRFVHDQILMEDIVQDVFCWIWEHRARWIPGVSVRAYLYRAVHNKSISDIRKKKFEYPIDDYGLNNITVQPSSQIEDIHNKDIADAIKAAIQLLPERRREILILHLIQGFTYDEIAAALGISDNTVDTQLRRARVLLREKLKIFQIS